MGDDGALRVWDASDLSSATLERPNAHSSSSFQVDFSPDGSRLYFSSQRGPNVPGGQNLINFVAGAPGVGTGVTYELLIPEAFRAPAA